MSAIDPEKKAIVQELLSRRDTLPPEKAQIVDELALRFGLSDGMPVDATPEAQPWYSRMFAPAHRDDPASDVALKQTGAILRTPVDMFKGLVGAVPGAMSSAVESVSTPEQALKTIATGGPLRPLASSLVQGAVHSVAQPARQVGRGLGEFIAPNTQGPEVLPESPEWAQAAQNATVNAAGLGMSKLAAGGPKTVLRSHEGEALPKGAGVFEKIKAKLPANITAPNLNKWMGVSADDMMHGADPGAQLIKEGLTGASKEATIAKVKPALEQAGKSLEAKLQKAGEAGVIVDAEPTVMDALNNATKRIGKRTDRAFQESLTNILDDILAEYPNLKNLTPEQAHALKRRIGDSTAWKGNPYEADLNRVMLDMYGGLNQAIKSKVPGAAADQLRWGNLYQAQRALTRGVVKDAAGIGTGKNIPTRLRKAGKTLAKGAAIGAAGTLGVKAMSDLAQ